jgi:hypothetical protein
MDFSLHLKWSVAGDPTLVTKMILHSFSPSRSPNGRWQGQGPGQGSAGTAPKREAREALSWKREAAAGARDRS